MDSPVTFGQWLRGRRKALNLTRAEVAQRVGCSVSTLRKIEDGERRPSLQIAELLAASFDIPAGERPAFLRAARGELSADRLPATAASPVTDPAPRRRSRFDLPIPAMPLIGREPELAALGRLLGDPQCRLLTVTGPAGIGKTRLALEAAALQRERFARGVYFVSLASLRSSEFIVPAIAEALGFSFFGPSEPKTQLLNYLRAAKREMLIVLDNLEHLLNGSGLLAEILQRTHGARLLITSRERLNLQGEWVFDLRGLPVPPETPESEIESYSAAALFVTVAQRTRLDFELSEQDRAEVARICRLVDGVPLAIELAAAWVRALPCRAIAEEIERDLDFLAASAPDLPERHRSMRASFDHSWRLLSAAEQEALRRLSVFSGGFAREAAEQVAGAPLSVLAALVDKSLLRRSEADRYDLHELVRQYAAGRLRENPVEEAAARDRHGRYFLAALLQREAALTSRRQNEALAELSAEIDNLRLAWEWAVAQHQVGLLRQTVWAWWYYYELRSLFHEGEAMLLRALESARTLQVADAANSAAHELAVGQLQVFPTYFALRLGRVAEAQQQLEQSLEILRRHDDPAALMDALWAQGVARMFAGQFPEASQSLRESHALARASNRRWEMTTTAILIGRVEFELGNHTESQRWLSEGLALSQTQGDPVIVAFAISSLSRTMVALGRLAEAAPILRTGLQLVAEVGNRFNLGLLQEQLAQVAYATGDLEEASRLCQETVALYRELGDLWSLSRALNQMGQLELARGDEAQAHQCFVETLAVALKGSFYANAVEALIGIAGAQSRAGSKAWALQLAWHASQHPAATRNARARAEQLRAEIEAQLTAQQIEEAQASAKTLETTVAEILRDYASE